MTSRTAILINSPGATPGTAAAQDVPFLRGVAVDMGRYQRFLESDAGGAWLPSEIRMYTSPPANTLRTELRRIRSDYSLVVFCGHGEHVDDQTVVYTTPTQTIAATSLTTGSPRQVIIVDACRTITPTLEELAKHVKLGGIREGYEPNYRLTCRRLYDAAIARAEEGISIVYSCSIGQGADEDPGLGGHFTWALLRAAEAWSREHRGAVAQSTLLLPDAFALAERKMAEVSWPQRPMLGNGRRRNSFPLAVA